VPIQYFARALHNKNFRIKKFGTKSQKIVAGSPLLHVRYELSQDRSYKSFPKQPEEEPSDKSGTWSYEDMSGGTGPL